ncbi:hypothetical protein AVL62_13820 [Serinicoccus chungangensis]|uniref:UDP-N-acetylglucosamine kinase n=1 Tax=Serinicoccus chungangensis TaxID=767452 RepID=A0A0W8I3D5_9MICO|nr:kinase [Serinicoccus chungangensis]KUG52411.1 hypothetical protein AVL62_13820 [Serinicoccus chungangensis]
MPDARPFLLVVRGNSGSGKTAVAALQRAWGRGTANVGQDHLRRVVLREHDVPDGHNIGLIEQTVRYCVGVGYNVILEGILIAAHDGPMLRRLIAEHDGPTCVSYLQVPLEETLRRHERRPLRAEVEPAQLRDCFVPDDTLGLEGEVVIDAGSLTLEETVRHLLRITDGMRSRANTPTSKLR